MAFPTQQSRKAIPDVVYQSPHPWTRRQQFFQTVMLGRPNVHRTRYPGGRSRCRPDRAVPRFDEIASQEAGWWSGLSGERKPSRVKSKLSAGGISDWRNNVSSATFASQAYAHLQAVRRRLYRMRRSHQVLDAVLECAVISRMY